MKYNLSVAVMQDNEPIMYIYSKDHELQKGYGKILVYDTLKHVLDLDWVKICGDNEDEVSYTPSYMEFECITDKEVEDMYLLAIWQEIKED